MAEQEQEQKQKTPEEITEDLIKDLEAGGHKAKEIKSAEDLADASSEGFENKEESEDANSEDSDKKEAGSEKKDDTAKEQSAADDAFTIESQREEILSLQEQVSALQAALDLRLREDLDALSKEDQALVADLAGDDALERSKIITKLLKAGKISKGAHSPTQDARASQNSIQAPPKTPEEAAQQVLKAIEARSL